jgi:hypothetical protein
MHTAADVLLLLLLLLLLLRPLLMLVVWVNAAALVPVLPKAVGMDASGLNPAGGNVRVAVFV